MGTPSFRLSGEVAGRLVAAETSMTSKSMKSPIRIHPQGGRIWFERTDYDSQYRLSVPVVEFCETAPVAVEAAELVSVVKLLVPTAPAWFSINVDAKNLEVRQGSRWWLLPLVDDTTPLLTQPPTDRESVSFTRHGSRRLTTAIREVVPFAASMQDQLPILGTIRVENSRDRETLTLTATDRYVLARTSLWHRSGGVDDASRNLPGTWMLRVATAIDKDPLWSLAQIHGLDGPTHLPVWVALLPASDNDEAGTLYLGTLGVDGDFPKVVDLLKPPEQAVELMVPDARTLVGVLKKVPPKAPCKVVVSADSVSAEWVDDDSSGGVLLDRAVRVTEAPPQAAHVFGVNRDKLLQALQAFGDYPVVVRLPHQNTKPIHLASDSTGLQAVVMPTKIGDMK